MSLPHISCHATATNFCSTLNMSSENVYSRRVTQTNRLPPRRVKTTSKCPRRPPTPGDIPNPTRVKRKWNGDPVDWGSWPTGRPGPLVSGGQIPHVMGLFHNHDQERNEPSRTEGKVFHVAEFSSLVRVSSMCIVSRPELMIIHLEIFVGHVTEPELATRLEVSEHRVSVAAYLLPFIRSHTLRVGSDYCERRAMILYHYRSLIDFRFATSQRSAPAIYSTYTRRILSACGAPAAVWTTFLQSHSSIHSFADTRDGNTVFRKYSTFRSVQC